MAVVPFVCSENMGTITLKQIDEAVEKAKQWLPISEILPLNQEMQNRINQLAAQEAQYQARAEARSSLGRMMSQSQEEAFRELMMSGIGAQSMMNGQSWSESQIGSLAGFPESTPSHDPNRRDDMHGRVWDDPVGGGVRDWAGIPRPVLSNEQQRVSISELVSAKRQGRVPDPLAQRGTRKVQGK